MPKTAVTEKTQTEITTVAHYFHSLFKHSALDKNNFIRQRFAVIITACYREFMSPTAESICCTTDTRF